MPGKRYREPLGDDVLEQMLQEAGEEGLGEPQEPERGVPGAPGFNLGRLLEQGGRGFLEGAQLPVKAEPQTPAEGVAAGLTKVAGRVTTPIGQAKSLPVAGASLLKAGQYLGDFVKGLAAPLLTGFEWHYEPDTGDFVKHDTEVVENLPPEARRAIERDGFYVDQKKKEIIQPFQVNGRIEYRIMRELERKASPLGSAELTNTWLKSTGDPELTALAEAKTPSIPVPQVPVVKQLAELGNMMIGGGEDPIKYAASLYGFGKAMGPFHKAIGPGAGMVEKGLGAAARKLAPGLEKPLTAAARTLGQEVAPFMAGAGTIAAVEAPGGDQEALEAFKQGAVGALPMWAGFKALGLFTGPMAKAFTRTREVGEKIEQKQARGEEVKPAELDEFRKVIEGDLYELGEADIRSLAESARKHPRGGDLLASQILKRWEDSRAAHIKDISGLPNRRAFQKQYHAMLAEGWTPVRMDGDRTKAYNDTYGHTFTDKILGEQGRAIERTAKAQGGRAYHVSGDEYEVMYPPGVDAYKSAAEVREAVGTLRIKAPDGTEIRPSVTAGVGRPGEFEELADQAANYAKYRRSGLETYDSYDQLTPEQKVAVRKAREGRPTDIPTLELRNRHQAEILREAKIPEARWADMLTETEMDVSGELYQLAAKYYKGEIKLAEAAKAARNLYDRLPTTADKASVDQVENKVLEAIKAGQTHADMIAATTDLGIADINRALSKLQLKDVIKRDPRTNTWQHTGKEVEVRATGEEPPPGKKALADLEPDELRAEVDQMVVRAGGGEDRRYRLAALSPEEAGRARALEYLAALKRRGATAEQLAPLVEAIEAGKATFKNHEQLVRQAVEARQPVSAFAVNKYRIPLPSEYDLVRNTWVWKGEPPETPESEPSPEPVPEPGPGIIEGEYDFRRQAEEAGWGKEEVEAVMGLVRARAKVKGQAPDEWLAGKKLRIERGGEPGPGALAQIGPVYHGRPHTFDKFSTDKIGTGEGAQAFGWGLYFTSKKDVARYYASEPRYRKAVRDERPIRVAYGELIRDALESGKTKKQVLENIENELKKTDILKDPQRKMDLELARDKIAGLNWNELPQRVIYETVLHKGKRPGEYKYLQWDRPVDEGIIEKITEAAEAEGLGFGYDIMFELSNEGALNGERIYDSVVGGLKTPKAASLWLLKHGIDGIEYPAGSMSGGKGDGRNYVVFDDRAVTINKRTLYQRGQPEAREVEMEYVAEDGRRYTEKLTQVPIETAITRHRREAPDLLGWQAQEARERLPKFKLAYTSAGELRVMSGPKVDNRVPDFLTGNTERKAQMIVESRTMEEVEGYLDDIFGTHQELDALAESGKTSRKLELADLFRADLEHAARERDIEAVKAGLDELKYLFATDPKNHYELYQKAGARIKGSVELADGSTIIRAFEGADVSTLVHELGHVFRLDLAPEELAAAEKAFGVRKGSWDTAAEERFARGFEEYLRTGKAPQPELEGVMAKLKAWLAEIYQSVRNTLTDKQRDFYDRMLGKPEGEKPATTRVAYAVDDNSREALTFILSEIESGWTAPGGLVRNEDGEVVGKYGNMSGFSDFAKKLVGRNTSQLSVSMSADELARAITRALEGETVTERQSRALDDAMDIYREHQGGGDTGWLTEAMKDWAQLSDLPKPRARYAKHIKEWSQEEMPDLGQRRMSPRPAAFTEGGEIEARTVGGPYGEAEGRGLPLFDERSQMTQDELDRKLGQVFMDLGIEQPMSRVKGQGSSETGGLPEGAEGIRPRGQGAKGELPGVNTNQKLNAKDWQIELPAEPATKDRVTKLDILQQVARDWGVPVRNMATHRFKNPGMYYPHKVLIRLKNWGELEPLAHELAHHLDRVLARRFTEKNPKAAPGVGWRSKYAQELGPLDYDQQKKRPSEGFAEFMRYYLTGETGPEKAPDFHKFFTGSVLRDNPDLAGKLGRLRSMIKTWYDQGAEARVMAQIGPRLPKTAGERTRTAWEWFNRKFRDANRPFEKLVDELKGYNVSLKPSQDPFQLATFFNKKAKASAWHWLFTAQVDPLTGKKIGEPLSHALRDIAPRDFDKFMAYWVAKREKVRYQRNGLESGFDLTDIDHVLKKHQRPEWDRAIDEATEWDRNLLRQYLVRPGLLNQSQLQAIMELNPIYLPFKRMPQGQESPLIPGGGKYANAGKGIHRVKGGSEPIEHPIKQLMAQTQDLVARGQRAYVTKALVDLTEKHGVGGIINEVPAQLVITKKPYGDTKLEPFKRTEQGAEPIPEAARATDEYLTPDILKGLLKENGFAVEDADIDAMLTVFTQSPVYRGKDNIVSMWKDGRQHFYEVNPEIYRALLKLDIPRITGLLKIMAPFSRGLRLGATGLNATFSMLTNPVFRDPFTYAAQSRFPGSNPLEPIGTNLRRLAKTTELEGRAEHAGMGASAFLGTDRNLIYDEMLMRNRRTLGNRMLLVVKHPIETLKEIFSFGEMGPRMLELRKAYEDNAKKHPDWTEEDRFVDAFNAAQDVTVNFTRMGEWGEKVNQAAAFFNVAIQGPDKMIRSARRNPAGFVLRGMAYLSTLGVANWAANRKKQWYKNLPLSYKYSNLFWEIPGAGTIVRCPLPFELGTVFVGLPVASLDAMEGGKADEKARAWLETLKAQMPDPMPTMVQPALDVARNKDWLGRPIESKSMEYLPVTKRTRYYTSALARVLSEGFGKVGIEISPVQLDYMMAAYSGNIERAVPTRFFKRAAQGKPAEAADWPVVGRLILRDPESPRRQMEDFWLTMERLTQQERFNKASGLGPLPDNDRRRLDQAKEFKKRWDDYYSVELKRLNDEARKDQPGARAELKRVYAEMQRELERFGFD